MSLAADVYDAQTDWRILDDKTSTIQCLQQITNKPLPNIFTPPVHRDFSSLRIASLFVPTFTTSLRRVSEAERLSLRNALLASTTQVTEPLF